MVDHYSDYLELDSFSINTSANSVIRPMEQQFAHHWIPDELITGNGPQGLLKIWATIVKSPPYHSRGNGKAELAVKIAKNILKKPWKEDPYLALLAHKNTPQQAYNYSQHNVSCQEDSRISTHPTDSIPMSGAWRHRRKKTKINGSVQREGFTAS